jgi:hypothetical protein
VYLSTREGLKVVGIICLIAAIIVLFMWLATWPAPAQKSTRTPPYASPPLPQATEECMMVDADTKEKVRALMLDAIDLAFKNHIEHTYEVWMRDDAGQPGRAATGVRNGLIAYLRAYKAAKDWNPRMC